MNTARRIDLSARAVEATVEHLQPLIADLIHDGVSVLEVSLALVEHAHMLASNAGEADVCFNSHIAAMVETGDMFECTKCERVLPASEGHADDRLCNDCFDPKESA